MFYSKSLKAEFDQIKKAFVGELPEGSGLRAFLESNLDKYMRASFAVLTNLDLHQLMIF